MLIERKKCKTLKRRTNLYPTKFSVIFEGNTFFIILFFLSFCIVIDPMSSMTLEDILFTRSEGCDLDIVREGYQTMDKRLDHFELVGIGRVKYVTTK